MMDRAESAVYWPFHWNHVVWLRCHLPLGRPSIRSKTCVKRIELINAPFFFLAAIGLQNSDFMLALTKEQQQQPISGFGHENLLTRHLMRRNAQEPCHSQLIYAPDFVCTEWQSQVFIHLAALLTRPNVTGAKSPDAPMRSLGLFDLTKCQL